VRPRSRRSRRSRGPMKTERIVVVAMGASPTDTLM
jgi:hypothetical protein